MAVVLLRSIGPSRGILGRYRLAEYSDIFSLNEVGVRTCLNFIDTCA